MTRFLFYLIWFLIVQAVCIFTAYFALLGPRGYGFAPIRDGLRMFEIKLSCLSLKLCLTSFYDSCHRFLWYLRRRFTVLAYLVFLLFLFSVIIVFVRFIADDRYNYGDGMVASDCSKYTIDGCSFPDMLFTIKGMLSIISKFYDNHVEWGELTYHILRRVRLVFWCSKGFLAQVFLVQLWMILVYNDVINGFYFSERLLFSSFVVTGIIYTKSASLFIAFGNFLCMLSVLISRNMCCFKVYFLVNWFLIVMMAFSVVLEDVAPVLVFTGVVVASLLLLTILREFEYGKLQYIMVLFLFFMYYDHITHSGILNGYCLSLRVLLSVVVSHVWFVGPKFGMANVIYSYSILIDHLSILGILDLVDHLRLIKIISYVIVLSIQLAPYGLITLGSHDELLLKFKYIVKSYLSNLTLFKHISWLRNENELSKVRCTCLMFIFFQVLFQIRYFPALFMLRLLFTVLMRDGKCCTSAEEIISRNAATDNFSLLPSLDAKRQFTLSNCDLRIKLNAMLRTECMSNDAGILFGPTLFGQIKSPAIRDSMFGHLNQLRNDAGVPITVFQLSQHQGEIPDYERYVVFPCREYLLFFFDVYTVDVIHSMVFSLGVPCRYINDPCCEKINMYGLQQDIVIRGSADNIFAIGLMSDNLYNYITATMYGVPMLMDFKTIDMLLKHIAGLMFTHLPGYEFRIKFDGSASSLVSMNPDFGPKTFVKYGSLLDITHRSSGSSDLDVNIFINKYLEVRSANSSKGRGYGMNGKRYTRYFTEKTLVAQSLIHNMAEHGIAVDMQLIFTHLSISELHCWNQRRGHVWSNSDFSQQQCMEFAHAMHQKYHAASLTDWLRRNSGSYVRCDECNSYSDSRDSRGIRDWSY